MNASASGAERPDIRKGDLVKAVRREGREQYFVTRVGDSSGEHFVRCEPFLNLSIEKWDFEVLDRPLPPISTELLLGATRAYLDRAEEQRPLAARLHDAYYEANIKAVINFVRDYDSKNATKENA